MHGPVEQLEHRRIFHHASRVHHAHHVGVLGHHAQVVRDEHDAHAAIALQSAQQFQDLRLDGDIERRGGLVGQQHLGLARQRHGDHHALTHAAAEPVRILVQQVALALAQRHQIALEALLQAVVDAHFLQRRDRALHGLIGRDALVQQDRLQDLVADAVHRVQAGHRLLEDHRDLAAAHLQHLVLAHRQQVAALKQDAAAVEAAGRARNQLHGAHRGHALAAARLPHHRQRLLREQRHVHARNGLDARATRVAGVVEAHGQIGHLKQRPGARGVAHRTLRLCLHAHQWAAFRSLGSIASRSASPSMLYASTLRKMASPGNTASHHTKVPVAAVALESSLPQLA